ncbi:MAG: glutamate synthase large subunit [Bacteroidota bacterium]
MSVPPPVPDDPALAQTQRLLYDPRQHHDACGVGFVATLTNTPSHTIVRHGLEILERLDHRGAYGCDEASGDGAGILLQLPHAFLKAKAALREVRLPRPGHYGVGVVFMPKDLEAQQTYRSLFEDTASAEGMKVLGWRRVPVKSGVLGPVARSNEPAIFQVFVRRGRSFRRAPFEQRLYVLRRRATKAAHALVGRHETLPRGFHLISLSSRTLVYKGMLIPEQLSAYFPDLRDPTLASALAVVHSRFSTNTLPEWHLAQPFRMLCHNGEINTVRGNRNWWSSREALFSSKDFGADLDHVRPVMTPGDSDSKSLDAAVELLVHGGRTLPEAVMLMIPEAWQHEGEPGTGTMDAARKAFYEYHACLMEPWDGPATIPFTDGRYLGAVLDRNGLRPSRYSVTDDGLVVLSSETGVLDLDPARIVRKGRLEPGRMLLLDLKAGRIIDDGEVKATIAKQKSYRKWLDQHLVPFENVRAAAEPASACSPATSTLDLRTRQRLFGVTLEDLTLLLPPMARGAKEALGSMGDDTPLAVLSDKPRLLYDYFRQNFAQVTNPPLDAIREELVTALSIHLGATGNLLAPTAEACAVIRLDQPILTQTDLAALHAYGKAHPAFRTATLDATWTTGDGEAAGNAGRALDVGLDALCEAADAAIGAGATILVLSDSAAGPARLPIPSLLAAGAVHHHLVRTLRRGRCELVIETQEAREVHHMACLLGNGATAICPTLALDSIRNAAGRDGFDQSKAEANYVKALGKGLLKVMSKMGISTLQSYQSAQQFEALGVARSVVDAYFTGTPTRIEGADLADIAQSAVRRHATAFQETHRDGVSAIDVGGRYGWRREGERHHYGPASIGHLQHAVRTRNYESYQQFAEAVDITNAQRGTLRSLLEFDDDDSADTSRAIPLSEVEPWTEIVKRFKTGAMSYGSISAEAHETLAVAMNRLGGKSNTGEGGEDPKRYARTHKARSAIKQVASGRFGVTIQYLAGADEIQIKMAQGAKPGEGGQLPGKKVNDEIARTRHSTQGVGLISPPPHHDIYSIEDLAQLIHDLKNTRPKARISVKLVAQAGVGTVAAGVAKAKADVILISGSDGGTGASPQTSVAHTGLPWELGLSEAQQALVATGLRNRVTIECDGHLKTGRDVAIAALLGAEEFGFATAPLVAMGCVMMRKCHLNVCPVGIATQHPALRKKFAGTPEHVVEYFHLVAQDLRRLMARLGFRTVAEMVGRVGRLRRHEPTEDERQRPSARKRAGLDLRPILAQPRTPDVLLPYVVYQQDHDLGSKIDHRFIDAIQERLDPRLLDADDPADLEPLTLRVALKNTHRSFGTMLSGAMARRVLKYDHDYPDGAVTVWATGSAGQSFGAYGIRGLALHVEGDANDYLGKGLSGATISVRPPVAASFVAEDNVIVGNVALYGATSGRLFVRGRAGERFAVRNSGAEAVVEGVGDHGCEYMTGGRVVVLGATGRNFAAGMSGGLAYVLDTDGRFAAERCNPEMVDLFAVEPASPDSVALRNLIEAHAHTTGSHLARRLLDTWTESLRRFVKVYPTEYRRALEGPTGSGDGIASDRDLARYTVRISGRDWGFGDREKSE